MVLIVGLGNPGARYSGTRHNLGFEVVDLIAESQRVRFTPGRGSFWQASCSLNDSAIMLLKPTTFMNDSGVAVLEAAELFEIPPDRMLVLCDDFQIPLGTIRIRPQGSDGGHNGLASILYHLGTDLFPRLRCGIGTASMPAAKEQMATFVLNPFLPDERPMVRAMCERARDACLLVVSEGVGPAMNRFNSRPELPIP